MVLKSPAMVYDRINDLLDKYWRCATTVEEEKELRRFFSEENIPPEWLPYQAWFRSEQAENLSPLGPDFDRRVMENIRREKRRFFRFRLFYGIGFIFFLLGLLLLLLYFRPFSIGMG